MPCWCSDCYTARRRRWGVSPAAFGKHTLKFEGRGNLPNVFYPY